MLDLTWVQSINVDGMALLYRWDRQGAPVERRQLNPGLQGFLKGFFRSWDEEQPAPGRG